jgi:hypothetical protein
MSFSAIPSDGYARRCGPETLPALVRLGCRQVPHRICLCHWFGSFRALINCAVAQLWPLVAVSMFTCFWLVSYSSEMRSAMYDVRNTTTNKNSLTNRMVTSCKYCQYINLPIWEEISAYRKNRVIRKRWLKKGLHARVALSFNPSMFVDLGFVHFPASGRYQTWTKSSSTYRNKQIDDHPLLPVWDITT